MTETLSEIRDRLWAARPQLQALPDLAAAVPTHYGGLGESGPVVTEQAFIVEGKDGHSYLTGPAGMVDGDTQARWERASTPNEGFAYIQGRFVEADSPNGNNAFWSSDDLALGQPTVTHGPLNWLHDEKHIVGALVDSELVHREAAAASGIGTHIVAQAVLWKFIYPRETAAIQAASDRRQLWYSMECVSRTVSCLQDGCGSTVDYGDYMAKDAKACGHLRERSSVRKFNEPTFLGGAVILPPARPGWAKANAEVMGEAGRMVEAASLDEGPLSRAEAEQMVAQILEFSTR